MAISSITGVLRLILSLAWMAGQIYIIYYPMMPLIQRPLHLLLALALVILWIPLKSDRLGTWVAQIIDLVLLVAVIATAVYYLESAYRLTERMEGIDDILMRDVIFGVVLVVVTAECRAMVFVPQ